MSITFAIDSTLCMSINIIFIIIRMPATRLFIAALTVLLPFICNAQTSPVEVTDYACPDGWTYTGVMKGGKRNGEGIGVSKKGNIYTGIWKNNTLERGVLRAFDGNNEWVYEGPFDSNLSPNGFGIIKYLKGKHAGDEYIGNFKNGSKHGIGKMVHKNGKIDFGIWRHGAYAKPKGQEFQPGKTAYGIDLSHFNPNVDWDNLALYCDAKGDVYKIAPPSKTYLQPVSFVFVRATEGATVQDRLYKSHSIEAQRHAIPHGSYHLMAFTSSNVSDQVANFLSTTDNCSQDELPPVLDLESSQAKKAGKEKVMAMTLKWLKEVEKKTGRKPIIYTNDKFANAYLDMRKLKGYTIWKASYGKNKTQEKKKPQEPYQIWQFTHHGVAKGISPVDINVYKGSVKEFNHKYLKKTYESYD